MPYLNGDVCRRINPLHQVSTIRFYFVLTAETFFTRATCHQLGDKVHVTGETYLTILIKISNIMKDISLSSQFPLTSEAQAILLANLNQLRCVR